MSNEKKISGKNVSLCRYRKKNIPVNKCTTYSLQKFSIVKENVLCLVVDNASNMTKTIERLNESDPEADSSTTQDKTADESEDYGDIKDDCAMRINIHRMRCAVHTLQLAIRDGLKQPHYNKLLTKTR